MIKHVFVTAASPFCSKNSDGDTVMQQTAYRFADKSIEGPEGIFIYTAHYLSETIPMFIRHKLGEEITDVILLETRDTREPKRDGRTRVFPAPDGEGPWPVENAAPGTAAQWFKEWLRLQLPGAVIHDLPIDETKPAIALEKTVAVIRRLYKQTDAPDEWRMWIDAHGGFSAAPEVLTTAARMAAAEKDAIRTDGIFTLHDPEKKKEKKAAPGEIVNLTPFCFAESAKTLKSFLNYGQYLQMQFRPYGGSDPYAFVSYRQDPAFLAAVRSTLGKLRESNIRFWYDDGLSTDANRAQITAQKNNTASVFLGLLTKSYFESPACWQELLYAIADAKKGKKTFIFIQLEEQISLPRAVPGAPGFKGARILQRTLQLTDEDIRAVLNPSIQQPQKDARSTNTPTQFPDLRLIHSAAPEDTEN